MNRHQSESGVLIKKKTRSYIRANYDLYLLLLPSVLFIVIFSYIPMAGIQIAFKQYLPLEGIWGSPWIGFEHFRRFFNNYTFSEIMYNTISISLLSFLCGFPAPIILALSLNRLSSNKLKKVVQTVSYAPNFISVVVIVGMLSIFLSPSTGIINNFLGLFGVSPTHFMGEAKYFKAVYILSNIWQSAGFGSIVYLAALTSVDVALYEVATIDGANEWKKIWYIDLPSIKPTIGILLILSIGGIMNVGFEKIYLMQNDLNMASSEVIATYTYKVGLVDNRLDYSTAVGLFNSVVNCILLVIANAVSRKVGDTSLW